MINFFKVLSAELTIPKLTPPGKISDLLKFWKYEVSMYNYEEQRKQYAYHRIKKKVLHLCMKVVKYTRIEEGGSLSPLGG